MLEPGTSYFNEQKGIASLLRAEQELRAAAAALQVFENGDGPLNGTTSSMIGGISQIVGDLITLLVED